MPTPAFPRRIHIGAELHHRAAHFRVWAPKRRRVEVELFAAHNLAAPLHTAALAAEEQAGQRNDYFSAAVEPAVSGMRYGFRLDGERRLWPDPASRFQPDGPEGLSQLVDPGTFSWSDDSWRGVPPQGQVLYELHLGTFTPQGTWEAAAQEFETLADLGVTTVELMPVADFPGDFGWGYDGVSMFAPTRLYGTPDDFRRFVDRAHALGLGVILDVVYNHLGCFSNTLGEFSDHYTTDRYPNDWGRCNNFDGENSAAVREFYLANVRYWIQEFHLDGFRFDATQAMHDASPEHILPALAREARQAAGGRQVLLVAENEPQQTQLVRAPEQGGYGLNMLWNDDFHHSALVRLSGRREAYYSDYRGDVEELLAALKYGFLYQGQVSQWQRQPRGSSTHGLPAWALVNYLETHDQVANSFNGTRLHRVTSPSRLRAMTVLWLLSPQTPQFFQGQEFASSADFLYFADHAPEHRQQVADGRIDFVKQFPSINTPEMRSNIPNPAERATFERCRLDHQDRAKHRTLYAFHRDLLTLRREDPVFAAQRGDWLDGASLGPDALLVRWHAPAEGDRVLLLNFGRDYTLSPAPHPLLAPPSGQAWQLLFTSEATEYGGRGTPPWQREGGWHLPGESAVVLKSTAHSMYHVILESR